VSSTPTTGQTTAPTATPPTTTATTPAEPPPSSGEQEEPPPDEGGDEEPARFDVVFTASKAGVKPRVVNVAPFISVKVTLVSRDGSSHTLVLAGKRLAVGGTRKSAFVVLPGLRPQKSVRGVFDGRTKVRVVGSAEPGP
jgi:hypothetical protein